MIVCIIPEMLSDDLLLIPAVMISAIQYPHNYSIDDIPTYTLYLRGINCITCHSLYNAALFSSNPSEYLSDLFELSIYPESCSSIAELLKFCDERDFQVKVHKRISIKAI